MLKLSHPVCIDRCFRMDLHQLVPAIAVGCRCATLALAAFQHSWLRLATSSGTDPPRPSCRHRATWSLVERFQHCTAACLVCRVDVGLTQLQSLIARLAAMARSNGIHAALWTRWISQRVRKHFRLVWVLVRYWEGMTTPSTWTSTMVASF